MTDLFFSTVFYRRAFPAERRFLSDKIKLPDVMPDRPLYVAAGQALSVHEYAVKSHPLDPCPSEKPQMSISGAVIPVSG